MSDLVACVFTELPARKPVDTYRRYLQRRWVEQALSLLDDPKGDGEAKALVREEVMKIQRQAQTASAAVTDVPTRAHWAAMANSIAKALKTGE